MTPPVVQNLHPPRLPADFVATGWPDLLAAFGLGLFLAAVAALLLAPLLRPRPRRESLAARLARLGTLPPDERLLGQLRLLDATGISLPDDLRAALYGRTPPDPEALDALIASRGRARA
jgi:hypothetical protein